MSADEMFQELGYKKLVGETTEVFKLSRASKNIYFSKNQKCKELGWYWRWNK